MLLYVSGKRRFIRFAVISAAGWTGTLRRSSFYACAKRFEQYKKKRGLTCSWILSPYKCVRGAAINEDSVDAV